MSLKERIVHESLKLFSLKGFSSTTLHDILQAAGTSKGGFYNHFRSKEDLFYAVLDEARKTWRERNLDGLDQLEKPVEKVRRLLENFRDRYLKDSENFPGGCVFMTLSVELKDHSPHLSKEIDKGFHGLKNMIRRLLDEGVRAHELKQDLRTGDIAEMLFAGMLGASVIFGANKSRESLDRSMNALIDYVEDLRLK